nr:hypothetical protein [Tanacetum cinerariifolium]
MKFQTFNNDLMNRFGSIQRSPSWVPSSWFYRIAPIDTFYNALNPADQDSLNSAAGGNLLERRTQDVLTIIKNKSSDANSSSSEIAKLTHAVNQQTSVVTTDMTAILKQFQATPPSASIKAVEEICVTCGEEDERVEKTLTDQDLTKYTIKFTFPADFVIVDYESDLRVLLILGRPTASSSPNHLLEEFADKLTLITFLPRNDDLPFDIESHLEEIEYLLHHDPIKDMDSILKNLIDQSNLINLNDNLADTMLEMFIDKHALDYSSPQLYDEYDDDLFEVESDTEYMYDDRFDSKGEKIKDSKLLIDELDRPRSSDLLPSFEYDSFLFEDFSKVDALPSTNNEDKVFNPTILIQENLFEVITRVAPDKNGKKIAISHASLILEDFDPPLYELPFFKEVPSAEILLSFSFKNKEKVFKPRILTSKGIHSSLISELSHQG